MKRLIACYGVAVFWFILLATLFPPDLFVGGFLAFLAACLIAALAGYPSMRRHLRHVEQRGRSGFLYGFYDRGNLFPGVKIGRESEERSRLRQHKTAAPLGIRIVFSFPVPDTVYAEWYLHQRYKFSRIKGGEWFFY